MLEVLWQLFAVTVVVAVLGLIVWDSFLRGVRGVRARALSGVAAVLAAGAGVAKAEDSRLWLPLLAAGILSYALGRNAAPPPNERGPVVTSADR